MANNPWSPTLRREYKDTIDGDILRPSPPPPPSLVARGRRSWNPVPEQATFTAHPTCAECSCPLAAGRPQETTDDSVIHQAKPTPGSDHMLPATSPPPYNAGTTCITASNFPSRKILYILSGSVQPVPDADLVVDARGFLDLPIQCPPQASVRFSRLPVNRSNGSMHPPAAGGGECSLPFL